MKQPGHEVVVGLAVLHLELARGIAPGRAQVEGLAVFPEDLPHDAQHVPVLEDPVVAGARRKRGPGLDHGFVERAAVLQAQEAHARREARDMSPRGPLAGTAVEHDVGGEQFAHQLLDRHVGGLPLVVALLLRRGEGQRIAKQAAQPFAALDGDGFQRRLVAERGHGGRSDAENTRKLRGA